MTWQGAFFPHRNWKICSSCSANWIISTGRGRIKHVWNQLDENLRDNDGQQPIKKAPFLGVVDFLLGGPPLRFPWFQVPQAEIRVNNMAIRDTNGFSKKTLCSIGVIECYHLQVGSQIHLWNMDHGKGFFLGFENLQYLYKQTLAANPWRNKIYGNLEHCFPFWNGFLTRDLFLSHGVGELGDFWIEMASFQELCYFQDMYSTSAPDLKFPNDCYPTPRNTTTPSGAKHLGSIASQSRGWDNRQSTLQAKIKSNFAPR